MSIKTFKTSQFLPITPAQAWSFFSTPKNLARITPESLDFKIKTPTVDVEIYNGMIISYTIKPFLGIPIEWVTEIKDVNKNTKFTDVQLKGPYTIWEHSHIFTPAAGGIMMHDIVEYKLPFGIIGEIVHTLFVKKEIENIFKYRKQALKKIFF